MTNSAEPVLMCWSGGKDSAMALHALLEQPDRYNVVGLLTTVTESYDRISMHGVRRSLLRMQSERIGRPLHEISLSIAADNKEYESKMAAAMEHWRGEGVTTVAFGDIFLEDLRQYREGNLAKVDMRALFPLWKRDTAELARHFVRTGFRAVVACLDPRVLDSAFAGRALDADFFADLPAAVDLCGENGEFHTFVHAGPIFSEPIGIETGEVVVRDGFIFCDVIPAKSLE